MALQYRITEDAPIDVAVSATYEIPFSRSKDLLGGEKGYQGMLILSKNFFEHTTVCANLYSGKDGDESYEGWALGLRSPLTDDPHGISAGIELLGNFNGDTSVLAGVYMPLSDNNIILKTGLEFGNSVDSMRLNTTLMIRF